MAQLLLIDHCKQNDHSCARTVEVMVQLNDIIHTSGGILYSFFFMLHSWELLPLFKVVYVIQCSNKE
jgi:hypothetical protein